MRGYHFVGLSFFSLSFSTRSAVLCGFFADYAVLSDAFAHSEENSDEKEIPCRRGIASVPDFSCSYFVDTRLQQQYADGKNFGVSGNGVPAFTDFSA